MQEYQEKYRKLKDDNFNVKDRLKEIQKIQKQKDDEENELN